MDYEDLENINDLKKDKQKKVKGLKKSEESIQISVVKYLKSAYPDVLFRCAPDNIRMSIGQAMKSKRSGMIQRSLPDVEVFLPTKLYHGLFIELKKNDFKLRKADGTLYKNEHVAEQLETLLKLKKVGYAVSFGVGFAHAKEIIDTYIEENLIQHLEIL
jgi:hypothetical protein